MIERIIDFSARNRFLIFLLVAVAAVGGWIALKNIPIHAIPDLSHTHMIFFF